MRTSVPRCMALSLAAAAERADVANMKALEMAVRQPCRILECCNNCCCEGCVTWMQVYYRLYLILVLPLVNVRANEQYLDEIASKHSLLRPGEGEKNGCGWVRIGVGLMTS